MDLLKKNLNQFSPLYPPRYNSVTEYPSERAPAKKQFPASHPDVDLSVLNMSFSTLSLSCWTVFCLRVGGNNSRYHGVWNQVWIYLMSFTGLRDELRR